MSYPYLSLGGLELDTDLIKRLPKSLAYYHLALPLAEEDGQITMVMASPDNTKVKALLEQVLGQPIIAVQGDSADIQSQLDHAYGKELMEVSSHILCWAEDWSQADAMLEAGRQLAPLWGQHTQYLDGRGVTLASLIDFTQEGFYKLVILGMNPTIDTAKALRYSQTNLLLLDAPVPPLRRLLVALQGHSPDYHTLSLAIKMGHLFQAQITLLGVASIKRAGVEGIGTLLNPSTPAGQHLQACQQQLLAEPLTGSLKLRQGIPEEQIAQEYLEGQYDLLAIAIETHGEFVQRIMTHLSDLAPQHPRSILAVKPIL